MLGLIMLYPLHLILYLALHRARPLDTDGLVTMIKNCKIFQYADDCKFAKIILSIVDCILLQADLDALVKWYMNGNSL